MTARAPMRGILELIDTVTKELAVESSEDLGDAMNDLAIAISDYCLGDERNYVKEIDDLSVNLDFIDWTPVGFELWLDQFKSVCRKNGIKLQ